MVELDLYIESKSASASFKEEGLQVTDILSFFHLCFPSILRITTLTMFIIPSIPEGNPSDTLAHFFWKVENWGCRVKLHLECRNVHFGIEEISYCNVFERIVHVSGTQECCLLASSKITETSEDEEYVGFHYHL